MMPAGLLMLPTLAWACPNCPSDGRTRVATGIVDTFWDTADGARPGDAIVARPLTTMTTPGPATTILRPDADWQRGPLCQHRGADVDWHTTEGACVVKRDGTYDCFYSGSAWFTETYGVHAVSADAVPGQYWPALGILRATPGALLGLGHNSIVASPDGAQPIVYHA